jgi:hypothetical protein
MSDYDEVIRGQNAVDDPTDDFSSGRYLGSTGGCGGGRADWMFGSAAAGKCSPTRVCRTTTATGSFWLALLLVALVFVARGHDTVEWEPPEPEWRHGHAGFGLYTHDEYRIDSHDPSDET